MPVDRVWVELIINVAAGTLAGGITNHVAVWMLFHPHEKRFGVQGAIPKNKARLAKSLGRTVGERLLTPEDFLGELAREGVRDAFDEKVAAFVTDALETERPSLSEMLPPQTLDALRETLSEVAVSVFTRAESFLESEEFTERVRAFVARARTELDRQAVGELVSPAQREKLAERARSWAAEFSRSPGLEAGIREYLQQHGDRMLASNEAILSRVPASVLRAIEGAIESYLVTAGGDYLLRLLRDESTHAFIAAKIRDALESAEKKSVGELLSGVTDEMLVRWISVGARSERARDFMRDAVHASFERALTTRIGRPAKWLPDDASSRLAAALSPLVWDWIQEQLPRIVRELDVEAMVERKVQGFSVERMEEIIRGVTGRELKLIVQIGYLLGAAIGLLTFGVSRFF